MIFNASMMFNGILYPIFNFWLWERSVRNSLKFSTFDTHDTLYLVGISLYRLLVGKTVNPMAMVCQVI